MQKNGPNIPAGIFTARHNTEIKYFMNNTNVRYPNSLGWLIDINDGFSLFVLNVKSIIPLSVFLKGIMKKVESETINDTNTANLNRLLKSDIPDFLRKYTILEIRIDNEAPIIPPIIPSTMKKITSFWKFIIVTSSPALNKSKVFEDKSTFDTKTHITDEKNAFQILLTT